MTEKRNEMRIEILEDYQKENIKKFQIIERMRDRLESDALFWEQEKEFWTTAKNQILEKLKKTEDYNVQLAEDYFHLLDRVKILEEKLKKSEK